jgi:cyclopropane fatty-acyl-phospholipid synthase-like methyltransferase
MWHFGVDSIDEYTGKEFHVTFEEGMLDLFRIYTKRMENNKQKVRAEHQEYPNQAYADAIVKKLFPDGHLIDVNSNTAKEGRT